MKRNKEFEDWLTREHGKCNYFEGLSHGEILFILDPAYYEKLLDEYLQDCRDTQEQEDTEEREYYSSRF